MRGAHTGEARRVRVTAIAVALLSVGLLLSGCASTPPGGWFRSPGNPVFIPASGGCPAALLSARDVRNMQPTGPSLLPSDQLPTGGQLCLYTRSFASSRASLVGQPPKTTYKLTRDTAVLLARVVNGLPLTGSSDNHTCPAGNIASATIIALRYPHHADVDLWYSTGGCQRLDNGIIAADQGAGQRQFNELAWFVGALTLDSGPGLGLSG